MTNVASPAQTTALIGGLIGISQQAAWMERALAHYEGRPRRPLVVRPGEVDDSAIVSPIRLICDKSVSFLVGEDVPITVDNGHAAAEDWLNLAWNANRKVPLLQKAATNGALFGHVFVRIVPGTPFPKLVLLDTRYVELITNPDDLDETWRITVTLPPVQGGDDDGPPPVPRRIVVQNPSGAAGYKVDVPEQWEILEQEQQGGAWRTTVEQAWPYPWCPIAHCQNLPSPGSAFGVSDVPENVLHLADVLNRLASQISKILRVHASPLIYSKGMGQRMIDRSIDAIIHLPSAEADLKALALPNDLANALAFYDKLLSMLAAQSRTPLIAIGMKEDEGLGPVSGVALRLRYAPLLDKTRAKQELFGQIVTDLSQRMLDMAGFGSNLPISLHWPNPLPADELAEAQTWVLHSDLGIVSKETLASKAGYKWDEEQVRIQAEKATEPQPALVQPLGAAVPDVAKSATEDKQQAQEEGA